jgi:hypothetical protein
MDLDAYRAGAESFTAALSLEYYLHYAGHRDELGIEPIYERHAELFGRPAVDALRTEATAAAPGDEGRSLRALLDFAVEGHLGLATKALDAELARREAELQLDVGGERLGFRESSVVQANEPDGDRRARIEEARLEATASELNPLRLEALELQHALARDLGWSSYREMCEELKGLDLDALAAQTAAFAAATEDAYAGVVDPALHATVGAGLGDVRRSDLPRFFRFEAADGAFPEDRLVGAFEETLAGLGIDLRAQGNVVLDVESRPGKSPRAFCAPVRVPGEVYLVVPPMGGRDDYAALLHEGGHAEHFASVDPGLPFEFRHLGDNSVTEGYAFLFDHLLEDPEWLARRLGVDDAEELLAHSRAQQLMLLRRYAAKLAYELELHGGGDGDHAGVYAHRLTEAVRVPWPREQYLMDVDPGFYAAAYLRAWAFESRLRTLLRERFGPAWFESPPAGQMLRDLWAQGQRLDADELLTQLDGGGLDFAALAADLGAAPA